MASSWVATSAMRRYTSSRRGQAVDILFRDMGLDLDIHQALLVHRRSGSSPFIRLTASLRSLTYMS